MLRNSNKTLINLRNLQCLTKINKEGFHHSDSLRAGNKSSAANLGRQSKVINKLFGARVSGSKKRWVPTNNVNIGENVIFKASQFGKSAGTGTGKNTKRRMAVLNKLFMKHVSDLLATGEASEAIVGKGMQVTKVKISPDFSYINVYWLGNGDLLVENQLEKDLHSCAGYIRHELSQLCLMSEVPKIRFVRDKTYANMEQVEDIIKKIDFSSLEETDEEQIENEDHVYIAKGKPFDVSSSVKKEFFGESIPMNDSNDISKIVSEEFPSMRQDVLGLDHQNIMSKITTKMKKSKQAWEAHNQNISSLRDDKVENKEMKTKAMTLEEINERLALQAEKEEKFKEFLAKRKEKKNTPDRKKFRASDHLIAEDYQHEGEDDVLVLSKNFKHLYDVQDYIEDEDIDNKTKK